MNKISIWTCTATGILAASTVFGLAPVTPGPNNVLRDGDVHVVGVYEGTYPPGVQHGQNKHPQGKVTVKVDRGSQPKTLVLTSYEPVVWNVEAPPGVVVRVIASGYYRQTVEGLKGVPVTQLSHEAGDDDYFYAHEEAADPNADAEEQKEVKEQYDLLLKRVKELTGRKVSQFQGAYSGEKFELR